MSDDDSPPPSDFDYGEQRPDGQYENHPTIEDGEYVQEVRRRYVHDLCGSVTIMPQEIAESVARDPEWYSKTFCASCGQYVTTSDVAWNADGADWVMTDE